LFGGSSRSGSDSSGSSSTDSEDHEGSSSAEDHREDEVKLHGGVEGAEGNNAGGYALALEGLTLDNIGVLEVVQAQLQLLCSRCDVRFAVMLTAEGGHLAAAATTASSAASATTAGSTPPPHAGLAAVAAAAASAGARYGGSSSTTSSRAFEWGGACAVCSQDLSVLLRPRFVHEGSNVLAGLKLQGCRPLDLLPSVYGATCADCDAVGALRALQVRAAKSCSSVLSVAIVVHAPPGKSLVCDMCGRPQNGMVGGQLRWLAVHATVQVMMAV
jgi:hypothetical protein